jgi:chorismate mutase
MVGCESGCLGDRTRRLQSRSAVSVVAVAVRAIRGAICIDRDERGELLGAVAELLKAILERNQLTTDELISVIFTVTPDIRSEFPALGARLLGMKDVPLLCAQEIDVPGAMERVVRVMVYVETSAARAEIQHVYLRGAETLRQDIAQ